MEQIIKNLAATLGPKKSMGRLGVDWPAMEIGDGVTMPADMSNTLRQQAFQYGKKLNRKFITRTIDGSVHAIRIR